MKNWKLNSAVFIAAYLVFLLVNVPAATLVGMVTLPNNVKLGEVSGTLWSGKVSAIKYNNDLVESVKWSLSPLPLLVGSLSADVTFGKASKRQMISGNGGIQTGFSFTEVSLSDFTLRMPASQVADKMKLPLPVGLGGQMVLNLAEYQPGKPYCEALEGKVNWRKAVLDLGSEQASIGNIEGILGCDKGGMEIKISKKNPLGLQVTAVAGANNKFTAKGFIKPDGTMSDNVHSMVSATLKADGKGRFPFSF